MIGPGAMILLPNPMGINKYLSNAITPILEPNKAAVIIKNNLILPMRTVVQNGTNMNGFILHDCTVTPLGFYVRKGNCGGNLCDRQHESLASCACFQMQRQNNLVFSIEVEVACGEVTFKTIFRSKWFIDNYILNGTLPIATNASDFEDFVVEDRFFESLDNIFGYINRNCKFQVTGWAKRGEVMDTGVAQPSNGLPHNAPKVVVESSNLIHHITKIDPMTPHMLVKETIDGFRFDAVNGLNV